MKRLTAWQRGLRALIRAMQEGCKRTKPMRGDYFDTGARGGRIRACALGAAFVDGKSFKKINKQLDFIGDAGTIVDGEHPVIRTLASTALAGMGNTSLASVIVHLNDTQCWNRGRIIRWLQGLAKQPQVPKFWPDLPLSAEEAWHQEHMITEAAQK